MNQNPGVKNTPQQSKHSLISTPKASRCWFRSVKSWAIAASAFSLFALTGSVRAQTDLTWVASSGTFSTASNWNPALAPVDGDKLLFTNETSFTVNLSGNTPQLFSTVVSNHSGVFTINPNGATWLVTNVFRIGVADSTSTVSLANGTLYVANQTVGGTNAQLRIADTTTNLFSCVATLLINSGTVGADAGIVGANSNSLGSIIITGTGVYTDGGTGSGSTLTIGGSSSYNRLIVTNGGRLFVDGTLTVGNNVITTNNFMLVSDPTSGATITSAGDIIFKGDNGSLIVSNGAKIFEAGSLLFGNSSDANTGVVTGVGSSLIAQGSVQIGTGSAGGTNNLFTVKDGAFFSCGGTFAYGNNSFHIHDGFVMGGIGSVSTGSFVVLRSASNTTNHDSNFITFTNSFSTINYLNPQGPLETVSILSGATVLLTNSISIGTPAGNSNSVAINGINATLFINGGTLINLLTADNGGGMAFGGSTLTSGASLIVTNGGTLLSTDGTIGSGSPYSTGIVSGVSSVWSNFSNVAGFTNSLILGTGGIGSNAFLGVFNGGSLYNGGTLNIGNNGTTGIFNSAAFGGPGLPSTVFNGGSLNIGAASGSYGNSLLVTNATVSTLNLNVGNSGATNNTLTLKGGTLSATFVRVRPTNTVVFSGGTLNVGGLTFDTLANSSNAFVVGDATSSATYVMAAGGSGYHNFNDGGLVVTNNATLMGNGTLVGNVGVSGVFSPGIAAVGSIYSSNNLVFGPSATVNYILGTASDTATINGNLGLGGTINVTAGPASALAPIRCSPTPTW